MRAQISRTSLEYNRQYFSRRSLDKNALAISSNQSKISSSYDDVILKYKETKKTKDLLDCPDYWGGFSFIPYYFEFWEGHESRLNKRFVLEKLHGKWEQCILEP